MVARTGRVPASTRPRAEQVAARVNLERTAPIGSYPPPIGSPCLYPGPPPGQDPPPATSLREPSRPDNSLRLSAAGDTFRSVGR